jgi:hypothetical protein
MRRSYLLLGLSLFSFTFLFSQPQTPVKKERLNFAKTYLELGSNFYPGFLENSLGADGKLQVLKKPSSASPYFNIGGYHFWGHGDFYISIPLGSLQLGHNPFGKTTMSESVVTGLRFMPWSLQAKRVTPYLGGSWMVANFKQGPVDKENPLFMRNALRLEGGLVYGNNNWQIRGGLNFYPQPDFRYPVDQFHFENIKRPAISANLGIVYAFETTSKGLKTAEMDRLNAYQEFSNPKAAPSTWGDWFLGLGPSSAFVLSPSEFNRNYHPYFNSKSISKSYLDFSLGYHFNHVRMVTALAYRHIPSQEKGFGVQETVLKNSLLFESYYYLFDYNGCTPYLGLNVGFDKITLKENSAILSSKNQLNPGLTFGWDILPGKTEQPFVLRTNLRWFPFQQISANGFKHSLNQLEYNVIQLVWYPARQARLKQKRILGTF